MPGLLQDVGTNLAKYVGGKSAVIAAGWITRGLGLNLHIDETLSSLGRKLDEIDQSVKDLNRQILQLDAENKFNTARSELDTQVVRPVVSDNRVLSDTARDHAANPTVGFVAIGKLDDPQWEPNQLTARVSKYSAHQQLTTLLEYLLGSANPKREPLERLQAKTITPLIGFVSDPAEYLGYRYRSTAILAQQRAMLQYYLEIVDAAFNLFAEASHAQVELAPAIRTAQSYYSRVACAKKLVQQQLPQPLASDEVIFDMEYGIAWYTKISAPMKQKEAAAYEKAFRGVGPYKADRSGVWRGPTPDELDDLFRLIKQGRSFEGEKQSSVLKRMGFDLSQMDDTHHVWAEQQSRFSLDTGRHSNADPNFAHNSMMLVAPMNYLPCKPDSVPLMSEHEILSLEVKGEEPSGPHHGVQLEASADVEFRTKLIPHPGSTNKIPLGRCVVTKDAAWSSSDDSMATVSNDPGTEGFVSWHFQPSGSAPRPVTVTARYYGKSASIELSPPSAFSGTLVSLLIQPRNVLFPVPVAESQHLFTATLFYEDPLTRDRFVQAHDEAHAPTIDWQLLDAKSLEPIPAEQGGFHTTTPNRLLITPKLATSDLLVRAAVGDVQVDAPIKVDLKL